jgi:hypothetical protein
MADEWGSSPLAVTDEGREGMFGGAEGGGAEAEAEKETGEDEEDEEEEE